MLLRCGKNVITVYWTFMNLVCLCLFIVTRMTWLTCLLKTIVYTDICVVFVLQLACRFKFGSCVICCKFNFFWHSVIQMSLSDAACTSWSCTLHVHIQRRHAWYLFTWVGKGWILLFSVGSWSVLHGAVTVTTGRGMFTSVQSQGPETAVTSSISKVRFDFLLFNLLS